MARKKPTKIAIAAVQKHKELMEHYCSLLHMKKHNLDRQADWVKELSEETIIGRIEGINTFCEWVLHQQNSYNGFNDVDENLKPIINDWEKYPVYDDNPAYARWRVLYY